MKNKFKIFGIFAMILIGIGLINAFGVSFAYDSNQNPLVIGPGETKDIRMNLQNSVGAEALKLKLVITQGADRVSVVDASPEYLINSGSEIYANLKVSVPQNAVEGTEYPVEILISEVSEGDSGSMVSMSSQTRIGFKIKTQTPPKIEEPVVEPISEKPESKGNVIVWVIAIIIILLIAGIVFYLIKKRK